MASLQLTKSLLNLAEKCCAVCQDSDSGPCRLKTCGNCRGVWYCSEACQRLDWPTHKLLCGEYAAQTAPPDADHGLRRAIYFPVDGARPEVVWIGSETDLAAELLPCPAPFGITRIDGDPIAAAKGQSPPPHRCCVAFRGWRRELNLSIAATLKALDPPGLHLWGGAVVALRRNAKTGEHEDMTMADYRCALHFLAKHDENLQIRLTTALSETKGAGLKYERELGDGVTDLDCSE